MTKNAKILIVDDEVHISDLLQTNLDLEGYQTTCALNGKEALAATSQEVFDLVLLDVMLPDMTGMEVCQQIKSQFKNLPVLMLSALGQSSDKIKGLKSGADDYLSKPFNLTELLIRMEKLLDRFAKSTPSISAWIKLGEAEIDLDNASLKRNQETHILTPKESQLLQYLISRPNEVIHRREILDEVWQYDNIPTPRTIDNFISKFRKLIETNPNQPEIIKTIRGRGYLLITK